jgi:hypothetical protein
MGAKRIRMCLAQKTLSPSILLILSYPLKPSLGAHQAKTRELPLNPVFFFFFFKFCDVATLAIIYRKV